MRTHAAPPTLALPTPYTCAYTTHPRADATTHARLVMRDRSLKHLVRRKRSLRDERHIEVANHPNTKRRHRIRKRARHQAGRWRGKAEALRESPEGSGSASLSSSSCGPSEVYGVEGALSHRDRLGG